MNFVAVVDQAIALLRQRGRLTYRTLQLHFQLDAEHLEALKDGNRSGCQNITLVITSSDGVPCAHGHAPLITTGTLGTDSA